MNIDIFIDSLKYKDEVERIASEFNIKVLTELPISKPFFSYRDNGLNFFSDINNPKPLHIDFLKGSMGWRLKRSDHETLLKKTLGKSKDVLTIFDATAGLLSDSIIFL